MNHTITLNLDNAVTMAAMTNNTIKVMGVCPGCGTKHAQGNALTLHTPVCSIGAALKEVNDVVPFLVAEDV